MLGLGTQRHSRVRFETTIGNKFDFYIFMVVSCQSQFGCKFEILFLYKKIEFHNIMLFALNKRKRNSKL